MKSHPIRHFFSNIVCGLIANKARRKKVRVLLNSDVRRYIGFIRRDLNCPIRKLRTEIGYGAQNLIIIVNDAWVYKFPLCKTNPNEIALREKRIVDAFMDISPLPIPVVKVLDLDGMLVRKYPCVNGITFETASDDDIMTNMSRWASQIANFIYVISRSDPIDIRDLKPAGARRGRMCGWCHIDICGNFIIDPTTKDIVAVIDWEDCQFCNFDGYFHHSSLRHGTEFMQMIRDKYLSLYDGGKK